MSTQNEFKGYIKYFGPFTEDGSLDISKAAKSLFALDRFLKRYQKDSMGSGNKEYVLKLSDVNNNCSELVLLLREVLKSGYTDVALVGLSLKSLGVDEFGKRFFGTLGEQVALRAFAKGGKIKKEKDILENNAHVTVLMNSVGELRKTSIQEWDNYEKLGPSLDGLVQLEKNKEEEMRLGYKQDGKEHEVAVVKYEEKNFFKSSGDIPMEDRMNEPFDDSNAKEERIVGRFVDYYGLAHKYHFAFQARKNQDDIGKQKILCIVEKDQISKVIDYMKPENTKNVCISGKAIRDWEDRVDKIKIEWVNENEDYNPKQLTIE